MTAEVGSIVARRASAVAGSVPRPHVSKESVQGFPVGLKAGRVYRDNYTRPRGPMKIREFFDF